MRKKLLLIDIDDTICDSSKAYQKALLKCHRFLKGKYPLIDRRLFFDVYARARAQIHTELKGTASMHNRFLYFQRMFEILGLPLEPALLDDVTEMFWRETISNLRLYPHIREVLKTVKENNVKVGIVSDLVASVQIRKLRKLGIAGYVDFIVTSEEAGREKPKPSIFRLALKKAGCSPKETVMVGDSVEKDVRGAEKAGIAGILFAREGKRGGRIHKRF